MSYMFMPNLFKYEDKRLGISSPSHSVETRVSSVKRVQVKGAIKDKNISFVKC